MSYFISPKDIHTATTNDNNSNPIDDNDNDSNQNKYIKKYNNQIG